jgi:hypothetical protein
MRSVVQELLRCSPAFRFRSRGRRGNGRGLRRPVRLLVGTRGAGAGPNAVRPYVARGAGVWRIVWASPREKPRTSRTGPRYLACHFNHLWIGGMVGSPSQTFSTTPALGAPPLLI